MKWSFSYHGKDRKEAFEKLSSQVGIIPVHVFGFLIGMIAHINNQNIVSIKASGNQKVAVSTKAMIKYSMKRTIPPPPGST